MKKKIAILLPYKEKYSSDEAAAASIWVKDYLSLSKLKNETLIFTKEEDEIEGEACLAVPHQYAEPMLTGEKRTTDYIVIYDISLKQIVLKQKNYQDNHKEASQMCYQLPIMKSDRSGHLNCTEIYDNMKVFLWSKDHAYRRNDVVYYKNAVYKLLKANGKGSKFPRVISTSTKE